jgi:hypothetical protein
VTRFAAEEASASRRDNAAAWSICTTRERLAGAVDVIALLAEQQPTSAVGALPSFVEGGRLVSHGVGVGRRNGMLADWLERRLPHISIDVPEHEQRSSRSAREPSA